MKKALIVIDIQNDYFANGKFSLWNAENTLNNVEKAIEKADANNIPVILIQHIAGSSSPFFNEGTEGVEIHPRILKAAPNAKKVIKTFADSFHKTNLEEVLLELGVEEILVCGMMTQNCVVFTAISKEAEKYSVKILSDCCTTVSEPLHLIALQGVSTRVELLNYNEAI
ncbi:cysteine hydrolase family protein [Clostridium magnum]|uniref:Streptothricin hydrolase n=1 Tax=Clostridium magnum DSM 2767 TaxID=1121326 RepID=A0A162RQ79_9CLOT|nr:cysteine hydrolase family protein [Clostridium magnum]KZL90230.1 streptothricin hydrolase [Clostridium magnum DSM 2767]SHI14024.1 Nicotinamidase-related amidase [Clostridium magnum DSM 2767]